jgi:uncharacterized protein YndB with AHSA1/START domain
MSTHEHTVSLVLERIYPAPVEELFALWATKEGFESWWGPDGFRVEVHTLEPRVGGLLHYSMIAASPEMIEGMKKMGHATSHEVKARYSAFEENVALAITSVIDFLPGVEAYESLIAVSFSPAANGTRMEMKLHAMHDAHFTKMQIEGFTSQLGKLDRAYTK